MIDGNDGGVDITRNGGETWFAPPLPIGQFYHVSADTRVPYHVAGADAGPRHGAGPEQQPAQRGHRARRLARRRRRRSGPRRARRRRPEHRLRRRVPRLHLALRPPHAAVAQRQRVSGEPVGPRRRGHEVPLPVDRADRRLAARPEGRLSRRATSCSARRDGGQTLERRSARTSPATTSRSRSGRAGRSPATTPASRSTAPSSPSPNRRSRRASSGPAATTASCTSRATAARPGRTSRRRCRAFPSGARSA